MLAGVLSGAALWSVGRAGGLHLVLRFKSWATSSSRPLCPMRHVTITCSTILSDESRLAK